jgi:hypothetical protein
MIWLGFILTHTIGRLRRRRIAQELHDDIGQQLALLEVELGGLRDDADSSLKPRMGKLCEQVSEISSSARELSHGLLLVSGSLPGCRRFVQDLYALRRFSILRSKIDHRIGGNTFSVTLAFSSVDFSPLGSSFSCFINSSASLDQPPRHLR